VAAVLLVAATATAGSVYALSGTSVAVAGYTGCLTTASGLVSQVAPGSTPLKPCTGQQTLIHLSGLTGITAGTGLTATGSGTSSPTLSVDPAYQLPQGCASGQLAKSNGSNAWSCADDKSTAYSAGTGLDLSSANVFSIKPGYALPQSCGAGQVLISDGSGGWSCGAAPGTGGGGAIAYAHIRSDFTLDTANSKNVVEVSREEACDPSGQFGCLFFPGVCFKLSVPVHNAVATADLADEGSTSDSDPPVLRVQIPGDANGCGANQDNPARNDTDAQVTMTDKNGNFSNFGFYVVFN
jgi:hypothetical protein